MTHLWKAVTNKDLQKQMVDLRYIPETRIVERCQGPTGEEYLKLGASLTITEALAAVEKEVEQLPSECKHCLVTCTAFL